jgi:chorismate dehydratase
VSEGPLRVGRIAYTNVLPIEAAFDTRAVIREAIVTSGVPNVLNAAISAGELDVSPVSAAHFLRNTHQLEIFGDCGIIARGRVISVVLASPRPPTLLEGASIAVTSDSASGRALLESVLLGRYGVRATFEPVADPTAEALSGRPTLLIGDAAVAIYDHLAAEAIYDLGTAWFDWTGLPMVFAVWAVRSEVARRRGADLRRLAGAYGEARLWGERNRNAVVAAAQTQRPREKDFYELYYATLKYQLTTDARRGLARFGAELAKLEAAHAAR